MKLETPDGYRIERKDTLPDLLSGDPFVAGRIGGDPANWSVREVSDGNMNAVFEIGGSLGTVIVKQALPFIRVIGESWPFPLSRMEYEHAALRLHARHAPGRVPEIYHYPDKGFSGCGLETIAGLKVALGLERVDLVGGNGRDDVNEGVDDGSMLGQIEGRELLDMADDGLSHVPGIEQGFILQR
jgi:5-methylthioribose kinase